MANTDKKGWDSTDKLGFTLIEILVVLAVFTLLLTMTIPYLSAWYSPIRLNGATRELISNIRFTQQNAVTTQKNHLIRLDTAGNTYSVIKKDGGEQVLKTVFLPANISYGTISLAPVVSEIEFNAAAVPNSTGEINLKNNKDDIKKIEITPSGFVKE